MKEQTHVETYQPAESPRFGFAKPPPFGKGGFGRPPIPGTGGAVTIRRRFPCEIDTGGTPEAPLLKGAGKNL